MIIWFINTFNFIIIFSLGFFLLLITSLRTDVYGIPTGKIVVYQIPRQNGHFQNSQELKSRFFRISRDKVRRNRISSGWGGGGSAFSRIPRKTESQVNLAFPKLSRENKSYSTKFPRKKNKLFQDSQEREKKSLLPNSQENNHLF